MEMSSRKNKNVNLYYCKQHNKNFISKAAYFQHMKSPAHTIIYTSELRDKNIDIIDNKITSISHKIKDIRKYIYDVHLNGEKFDQGDFFLNKLSKPVSTPGYWVYKKDFNGTKSFGYYSCNNCRKNWISAHAHSKYKQACKNCDDYINPKCFWVNEKSEIEKNEEDQFSKDNGKPHDIKRCEACANGDCLISVFKKLTISK